MCDLHISHNFTQKIINTTIKTLFNLPSNQFINKNYKFINKLEKPKQLQENCGRPSSRERKKCVKNDWYFVTIENHIIVDIPLRPCSESFVNTRGK